jgi:hypothetical protein
MFVRLRKVEVLKYCQIFNLPIDAMKSHVIAIQSVSLIIAIRRLKYACPLNLTEHATFQINKINAKTIKLTSAMNLFAMLIINVKVIIANKICAYLKLKLAMIQINIRNMTLTISKQSTTLRLNSALV